MYSITRHHDFSAGHRVAGHESKCANFHGHNYRVHFTVTSDSLDLIGRVVDFSVVKSALCQWLEDYWDHKFLMWRDDPELMEMSTHQRAKCGIVVVDFNPTAEAMASYLANVIGPNRLSGTGVRLVSVRVDETRKCSATYFNE